MNIEDKKSAILREIADSDEEALINAIDATIQNFRRPKFKLDLSKHTHIKQNIDWSQLRQDHPVKKIDLEAWKKKVDQLSWEQSLEELLADLD